MDADSGGVCGVTGWAEGGDVVRTSTHDKNEYSITVKSSGILSGGEPVDAGAGHHDHGHGHRREEEVEEVKSHKIRLLRGHDDALLKGILRRLQDDHGSHAGHGGGGGVEHPLHGVDNILFAADSSSGVALQYAIKTFSEDFDSFVMRSGSFDLITSAEIGTSQYTCKRTTEEDYETELSDALDTAQVTAGTREKLDLASQGCLVPPCASEEDICLTDPSCSVSPYQEQETMKAGAIVGFCILGAAILIGLIVFFYQKKINKMEKDAKAKFASRMRMSFVVGRGRGESEKREAGIAAFASIDKDNSGLITKEELWEYIHARESQMTEKEFDRLFKIIDKDGSNEIDFAEFLMFLSKLEAKEEK